MSRPADPDGFGDAVDVPTTEPIAFFDPGLQSERTALAWERTAIAMMAAGILLARYSADSQRYLMAVVGMIEVAVGGVVLMWAGNHYDDLHGPLHSAVSPVHPGAARVVGIASVVFTGCALMLSILVAIDPR